MLSDWLNSKSIAIKEHPLQEIMYLSPSDLCTWTKNKGKQMIRYSETNKFTSEKSSLEFAKYNSNRRPIDSRLSLPMGNYVSSKFNYSWR